MSIIYKKTVLPESNLNKNIAFGGGGGGGSASMRVSEGAIVSRGNYIADRTGNNYTRVQNVPDQVNSGEISSQDIKNIVRASSIISGSACGITKNPTICGASAVINTADQIINHKW
ncbi:hypothetical protein O1D97_06825 [Marinomonas sp. 15G1-11]|uniref:Uncharacterized protein n=1 Tax=Marinomonas phaeophyticola TaxID=3004091 RepID=A0ABT4JSR1_9GAMM|nr:hypothetical protein [Marinomonas sp. 15G1-11]MCZ2721369.1 hypothetical protein [Marinomonas sp. 15G1-11]